jgi:hypothetical protein
VTRSLPYLVALQANWLLFETLWGLHLRATLAVTTTAGC